MTHLCCGRKEHVLVACGENPNILPYSKTSCALYKMKNLRCKLPAHRGLTSVSNKEQRAKADSCRSL